MRRLYVLNVGEQRFLERFSAEDREAIESIGIRRPYKKGAVLFLDGEDAGEVLLIRSGQIKLTIGSVDGREIMIGLRGPGEIIGEMSLIDLSPRSASAFALSPVEVLVLPVKAFLHLVDSDSAFTRALLDEMCRKLRDSTRHGLELGLDDVPGRVARRLAVLGDRFGTTTEDGSVSFRSPITQQELADWSGVSRQAVVKELTRLRELGWLETKGSSMVIRNPDGISARAAQLSGLA